jgi:alkylated DNA nucleotide flippase Atl1
MQALSEDALSLITRLKVEEGIVMCMSQQGGECLDGFEVEQKSEFTVKVWRRRVLGRRITRELYAEIPRYTWAITNGNIPYSVVIMYEHNEYYDDIYSAAIPVRSIINAVCLIGICLRRKYYAPFRQAVAQAVPRVQVGELGDYGVLVRLLGNSNPVVSVLEALRAGDATRLRRLVKSGFITHVAYQVKPSEATLDPVLLREIYEYIRRYWW